MADGGHRRRGFRNAAQPFIHPSLYNQSIRSDKMEIDPSRASLDIDSLKALVVATIFFLDRSPIVFQLFQSVKSWHITTMQAFLKRGASYFTPTSSQTNLALPTEADGPFQKAPCDTIFTKTDPKIDGEECLHDCDSCTIRYPSKFIVDTEDSLYGGPNGWATHLVIATGKSDWVRDVDDEEGSVMQAINKAGIEPDNGVGLYSFCHANRVDNMLMLTMTTAPQDLSVEYPSTIRNRRLLRSYERRSPPSIHRDRESHTVRGPRAHHYTRQPFSNDNNASHPPITRIPYRNTSIRRRRLTTLTNHGAITTAFAPHDSQDSPIPSRRPHPPLQPPHPRCPLRAIRAPPPSRIRAAPSASESLPRSRRQSPWRRRHSFHQSRWWPQVQRQCDHLQTKDSRNRKKSYRTR